MDKIGSSTVHENTSGNTRQPCHEVPPPPYFKTHFIKPSSFKAAIDTKLDNPFVSLFRLSLRILQFGFALAAGISYAIELSKGNTSDRSTFIYAQVVFGLTLSTLVVDSVTVRYYRTTWVWEWVLVILWVVCFGLFYEVYLTGAVQQQYQKTNLHRMRRAVWCNLVNTVLWFASAVFTSTMCCTGTKAAVNSRLEKRRQRKEKRKMMLEIGEMESGVVRTSSTRS
jgi:hypothetical protein